MNRLVEQLFLECTILQAERSDLPLLLHSMLSVPKQQQQQKYLAVISHGNIFAFCWLMCRCNWKLQFNQSFLLWNMCGVRSFRYRTDLVHMYPPRCKNMTDGCFRRMNWCLQFTQYYLWLMRSGMYCNSAETSCTWRSRRVAERSVNATPGNVFSTPFSREEECENYDYALTFFLFPRLLSFAILSSLVHTAQSAEDEALKSAQMSRRHRCHQ